MKHCPSCEFTFADFHHVCDFDGTELVPDPERPSLVKAPRAACLRRWLKSPFFLVALLMMGLLSSGLLIGYYDSSQSAALDKDQVSQPSLNASALPGAAEQTPARSQTPVASNRGQAGKAQTSSVTLRPTPAVSHSIARSYPRRAGGTRSGKSETEKRAEAEQISQRTVVASPPVKPASPQREESQQISRATSDGTRSTKPVTAQTDPRQTPRSQPASHEKNSGFTAMLKSTWRVLKRPFKF
jgi:hypothetical protein